MALKRSPAFCLKLKYRYLLNAGHFHCDTCGEPFWKQGIALIVFQMSCSCKCSVPLSHGAMGESALCDCGISYFFMAT